MFNCFWITNPTSKLFNLSFILRVLSCKCVVRLVTDVICRLNATDFLEKLRGKKLVFVGDSLNRNMWESLICILRHSLRYKKRVYEISGRREFKKKGIYAFRFEVSLQMFLLLYDKVLVFLMDISNCTVHLQYL